MRKYIATKSNSISMYNVLFPIWLLVLLPSWLWLILIPANYLIDRLVMGWSLRRGMRTTADSGTANHAETEIAATVSTIKAICRKNAWKICVAGFVSDFAGSLFLMAAALLGGDVAEGTWIEDALYQVNTNPFANPLSFIVVAAAIVLSGVCIYLLDRQILSRIPGVGMAQARRTALHLAIITAPYLFLIPSSILYS